MQNKRYSEKNSLVFRESANSPQAENILEVICDGKLSDIARPSLSRSSARSISQLSMQSTNMTFGLESLPDDKSSINDPQEEELFLEEALSDDSKEDEEESDFDGSSNRGSSTIVTRHLVDRIGKLEDSISPDVGSKDFDKEIMKIARKFNTRKQQRMDSSLQSNSSRNSSPILSPKSSQWEKQNSEVDGAEKEIDPKIMKGLEKIKKLDKILAEKIKMEKEAKADRKRLEENWQLEIKGFIEWCGENKSKPVIQQFLALTNGLSDHRPIEEDEDDMRPLFQTEVLSDFVEASGNDESFDQDNSMESMRERKIPKGGSHENDSNFKDSETGGVNAKKGKKLSKKNFIKRNIVLAAHANEIISLTEKEQERLDQLLADDSDLLLIDNPFSKKDNNKPSSGYELDDNAKKALTEIDEQLKCLVPQSDFQSICFSPIGESEILTERSTPSEFSERTGNNDGVKYGDENLIQVKNYREMQQRLQQIEFELKKMGNIEEHESQLNTPRISNGLLRQLIEVDSRLTSSALSILDSARSNLNTARTDSSEDKDVHSSFHDIDSVIDSSRTSSTSKSFHDIGV